MPGSSETPEMFAVFVRRAVPTADSVRFFEFVHPSGGLLPEFTAGAHISVRTPNGLLRKYSLCNAPSQSSYAIAVKRETTGRGGSIDLSDRVSAGDTVLISAPRNNFELKRSPAGYLFIAGGIGIAPMMSMISQLEAAGDPAFRLIYLARSRETAAFAEDLTRIGSRNRLTIHYDGGDPENWLDLWPILERPKGHVYCCGPAPLMRTVRDMTGHWPSSAVHFESFSGEAAAQRSDDAPFTVYLARRGEEFEVPAGTSILEVLRSRGLSVPSSCESGTCGTCRTGLVAGDADHRDLVLSEAEKQSQIMICVSRARSGRLTLDI
jgi:phthalate 4,5-dioxygenase reductase component